MERQTLEYILPIQCTTFGLNFFLIEVRLLKLS